MTVDLREFFSKKLTGWRTEPLDIFPDRCYCRVGASVQAPQGLRISRCLLDTEKTIQSTSAPHHWTKLKSNGSGIRRWCSYPPYSLEEGHEIADIAALHRYEFSWVPDCQYARGHTQGESRRMLVWWGGRR